MLQAFAARSHAASWTETDIVDLHAYYDVSDTASLTLNGSGHATTIPDLFGSEDLVNPGWCPAPISGVSTQNGLNVVDFTTQRMVNNSASVGAPFTIFLVAAIPADVGADQVFISRSANNNQGQLRFLDATGHVEYYGNGATLSYADAAPVAFALWTITNDGGTSGEIRKNRVSAVSGSADGYVHYSTGIQLGSPFEGGGGGWKFGEMCLASSVLTGADLTSAEDGLMAKWGL